MNILITNDDGIDSPGLSALAKGTRAFGKVFILAPDRNWSASGHVRTLDRPLRVKRLMQDDGTPAYATDGSPSDCVALAVTGFLPERMDLVISGINTSANLGQDVSYSGTIAAALEAAIWGIPAIAFSQDTSSHHLSEQDFSPAVEYAQKIIRTTLFRGLYPKIVLNVNIPNLPSGNIQGIQITRQGQRIYHDHLERRADPRGNPYYWVIGEKPGGVAECGTDIGAVADGYVSITPLQIDFTSYQWMNELGRWNWDDRIPIELPKKVVETVSNF